MSSGRHGPLANQTKLPTLMEANMSKTNIKLNLEGVDGNAFMLLGVARRTLMRNGMGNMWDEFHAEATSGDYNKLLCTLSDWFDVCFGDEDEDEYDEDED